MNWRLDYFRGCYYISSNEHVMYVAMRSVCIYDKLWWFYYVDSRTFHTLEKEENNLAKGLEIMEKHMQETIQQSPTSLHNMHDIFDELRERLSIKIATLQSLSMRKIASFFTPATKHLVDKLNIPDAFKNSVKACSIIIL